MWNFLGKTAIVVGILAGLAEITSFLDQSGVSPWAASVLNSAISLPLLDLVTTLFIVSALIICLLRQFALERRLSEYFVANPQQPAPQRLQLELSGASLSSLLPDAILVMVRVTNPTAVTVTGVSVHIEEVSKTDEPGTPEIATHSPPGVPSHTRDLKGLPLKLHQPSGRVSRKEVDLHTGGSAEFEVVTLQRGTAENPLFESTWHYGESGRFNRSPTIYAPLGQYLVRLKVRGEGILEETLSITIENTADNLRVLKAEH